MCQYAGGKIRTGKKIHDAILDYEKVTTHGEKLPYFEPFVGVGGVMKHFARDDNRQLSICD